MAQTNHNGHSTKQSMSRRSAAVCSMLAASIGSLSAPALTGLGLGAVLAQDASASEDKETARLKAGALRAMSTRMTLEVEDQPLEEVLDYIGEITGAQLEPVYLDSINDIGMDPSTPVSIRVRNRPALAVLERVLQHAQRADGLGDDYTWQLTEIGTLQCGPKGALDLERRLELYDIADLILVIPDFDNAPDLNLSSSGGSSGGGQSPFSGGSSQDVDAPGQAERIQALVDLIQSTIEPDAWASAGGTGASLTVYSTSLVINAPDYIHRQLAGYDFWPAKYHRVRTDGTKRWVEVRPDPDVRSPDAP